jgi:hypothetical protein
VCLVTKPALLCALNLNIAETMPAKYLHKRIETCLNMLSMYVVREVLMREFAHIMQSAFAAHLLMVTTPEQENISAIVAKARVAHKLKK